MAASPDTVRIRENMCLSIVQTVLPDCMAVRRRSFGITGHTMLWM